MPRKKLGEGIRPAGSYIAGTTLSSTDVYSGQAGVHAVRLGGRPFLAIVTMDQTAGYGSSYLSAFTLSPSGKPDLVEAEFRFDGSEASVVAAVAHACREGSADASSVGQVLRWLTTPGLKRPGLASSLVTRQGISEGDALRLIDMIPSLMEQAGFPKAFLDAMATLRAIPSGDRDIRRAVFEGSDAFRAACRSYPLLAEARWKEGRDADEAGHDPLRAMCEGPEEDSPNLTGPTLKRLRGLDSDDFFPGYETKPIEWALHLLGSIPPDWVPSDEEGLTALGQTSVLLTLAEEAIGSGSLDLLAGCKGNWPAFVRRCTTAAGTPQSLSSSCKDLKDLPVFLRNRLIFPLLARAGDADAARADRIATNWVYDGKSLPGALEASTAWHINLNSYEAALPDVIDPDEAWETPFEEAVIYGFSFVPLKTGRELREEGSKAADRNGVMGLAHCVGAYRAEARRGACHIVSIRRVTETGYERVATVELAQPNAGDAQVVQVRGIRNEEPDEDVLEAVDAYAERGRQAWPARHEEGADVIQTACGYDWKDDAVFAVALEVLRPLLPRWLRGLDEQALAGEATRAFGDVEMMDDLASPGGW